MREQRQKAVVDTLYQVDRSCIPFPDDPPIVYPDAEVWQQLTARRKDKYSSMDLAKPKAGGKEDQGRVEVADRIGVRRYAAEHVIDYLKDYHKIEIQLDNRGLDRSGHHIRIRR